MESLENASSVILVHYLRSFLLWHGNMLTNHLANYLANRLAGQLAPSMSTAWLAQADSQANQHNYVN